MGRTTATGSGEEAFLRVVGVTKRFGDFTALADISLEVHEGELICFLGPSGCGKTTLLRAIAGLDFQSSGRIYQRGRDVSDLPPTQRDFGIVFQSYALFPNMTVAKNVGYGLASRKTSRQRIAARVAELLEMVGLPNAGDRYPAALSGGQQQRVALARALATSPGMLLLDEPLSALDAKVRVRLRHEMKALQRSLGITTIMVTHDQEEALSMADRIVVMNHGIIEQVGTPIEIYRKPASAYVADFVGAMNFLHGEVVQQGRVRVGGIELAVDGATAGFSQGDPVVVCIRPEDVAVRDAETHTANCYEMAVHDVEFLGSFCRASLESEALTEAPLIADFSINLMRDFDLSRGKSLPVALPKDRLQVFADDGGGAGP
ncbi:MAG: putative 2-aminoethylphosphonate ABC transporter ATP-binding protein [Hyphomicrobiales bacterium]|nr:putative 2-aminoethylphosphonate ABC transporter ATP-binding protein [Hyphomicrobiales bacterium]